MKQQPPKKLYAFIVTAMLFSISANAQIVYTDVNPDTTIAIGGPYYGFYYLDLNNDGTIDDSISYRVAGRGTLGACGGARVSISALNGNAVAGSTEPLAMNLNDTISSALTWSASGYLRYVWSSGFLCTTHDTIGNWTNSIDHYLGLKLIVGNDTYYGWVRMQVNVTVGNPNTASGIIKDYAYNSIPNQPILAGQTCPPKVVVANAPTELCASDSLLLIANAGVCSASSLLWSTGETTTSIMVRTSGTYSVTLIDTAGNSTSDSVTVTIGPLPTPTVNASGATTFCAGNSVTLSSSVNGANYLWSNGATTQSISANATGNYSVTVTDTNGCRRTSAATSVTVNPSPTPTVNASGATAMCSGDSVTLSSSTIGTNYLWSNNATTQSISVNTAGNYSVAVTNANGCTGMSTATSVTVNPLPVPSILPNGNDLCTELFSSYQWQESGTDIPGETNQCYTPTQQGFFSVVVSDANGCVSNEFILTGEQNIFSENQLGIFPNPADNHLTIALGSNNKKVEVTITDITGKIIYTTIAGETQKIEVNTKDFAEGVYLVQVHSAAFIATKKLVVAK